MKLDRKSGRLENPGSRSLDRASTFPYDPLSLSLGEIGSHTISRIAEIKTVSDYDLTDLLAGWPLEPGRINARKIIGADKKPKLQVRIDLGVLQMEYDGRPDGQRPEGYDSLLALQNHRKQQYTIGSKSSTGFVLSRDECRALREEAMQYYHRYIALFPLEDFPNVIRDTNHILEIFELCRACGPNDEDKRALDPFRNAAVTMNSRAEAEMAIQAGLSREAMAALNRGLEELHIIYQETDRLSNYEHSHEVLLLRGMREMLVPKRPASQRAELQERIQAAIERENYELAAILRDELRQMKD